MSVTSPLGARDTYERGHEEAYELPLCGTVRKVAVTPLLDGLFETLPV